MAAWRQQHGLFAIFKGIVDKVAVTKRSYLATEKKEEFDGKNDVQSHTAPIAASAMARRRGRGEGTVDLRTLINNKILKNETFWSVELLPVKGREKRVYESFFAEAKEFSPLFYALTWHRSTATSDHCHLEMVKNFPSNTLFHLTANGLKKCDAHQILHRALTYGKVNIFVLQGDSEIESGDYPYAADLVSCIRRHFSAAFTICVAGYPEMHPKSTSKHHDLLNLKEKVDAGADFVITQFFFEPSVYIDFVKDCRDFGITVPIIPGILIIQSYKSLLKLKSITQVKMPSELLGRFESIKDDDDAVKTLGIKVASTIAKAILSDSDAHGFHLFSSNSMSSAVSVWKSVSSNGYPAAGKQLCAARRSIRSCTRTFSGFRIAL